MTKLRWERARKPRATLTQYQNADEQRRKEARRKPKPKPKLPKAASYLRHSNPDDRAFVAKLLATGLPPGVIAARTGMPVRLVQSIERETINRNEPHVPDP
jgi:hypothetical protein